MNHLFARHSFLRPHIAQTKFNISCRSTVFFIKVVLAANITKIMRLPSNYRGNNYIVHFLKILMYMCKRNYGSFYVTLGKALFPVCEIYEKSMQNVKCYNYFNKSIYLILLRTVIIIMIKGYLVNTQEISFVKIRIQYCLNTLHRPEKRRW